MTTKSCRCCGNEFTATNNAQQYCPTCKKEGRHRKKQKSMHKLFSLVCAHCEEQFLSTRKVKYCDSCKDPKCRRNTKPPKKKPPKNFMSIEEVARASREMGMSAGEYMTKFCYGKEGR